MDTVERGRLHKALGIGTGIHLLILLLLLLIPMAGKEEKIPLGALRVELGISLDNRAGEKKTPASAPPAQAGPTMTQPTPRETAAALPKDPIRTAQPLNPRRFPESAKDIPPSASEVPAKNSEITTPVPPTAAVQSPPAPRPVNPSLSAASSPAVPPAQNLEGLENLNSLLESANTPSGLSPVEGKTKFEAGSGNPVELEDGVINARPLPLVAPNLPPGTPTGELEVRFTIGPEGLVKMDPETLVLKGLTGNILSTPETSEEWRLLRLSVEKALRNWTFLTDRREIKGRVIFTIKPR